MDSKEEEASKGVVLAAGLGAVVLGVVALCFLYDLYARSNLREYFQRPAVAEKPPRRPLEDPASNPASTSTSEKKEPEPLPMEPPGPRPGALPFTLPQA